MGIPGYTGRIPKSAGTLPRLLRDAGYSTLAVGKWHLTPRFERNQAGPFEHWPLGLGFERYYGFLGALTDQWDTTSRLRQPVRRTAADPRGGLSPDRGPGVSGNPADAGSATGST